jgi:hypothetical protein
LDTGVRDRLVRPLVRKVNPEDILVAEVRKGTADGEPVGYVVLLTQFESDVYKDYDVLSSLESLPNPEGIPVLRVQRTVQYRM